MVTIHKRKVRSNGFGCPLHPSQVFTYLLFTLDFLSFYLIDIVSLSHNTILISLLGSVYLILSVGTVFYGYISTKIDPSDPTISLKKSCDDKGVYFDTNSYDYHCEICDSYVLTGSKHCG